MPDDMDLVGIIDKGLQGTNSGSASPICPEVLCRHESFSQGSQGEIFGIGESGVRPSKVCNLVVHSGSLNAGNMDEFSREVDKEEGQSGKP